MTAQSAEAQLGALIAGRYRVEALAGSGGMASVYRAKDEALGRQVALKVFRAEPSDPAESRRQRDEVQLLASLNHPGLVTLFDAIAHESEQLILVMEYVEGVELRERLATGPLDAATTAMLGAEIADALAYTHERGVVHRDVKPGNVLVIDREGDDTGPRAKLADFGIARLVDGTRLTTTGSVLGTASYLSPEQAVGGAITPESDVYSLGLVLLECLTGQRAFPGTALESASSRLVRDPDVPEHLGPGWIALLRGMTAREPTARPSAHEAAVLLRELTAALPAETGETEELDATKPLPAEAIATAAMMAALPAIDRPGVEAAPVEQQNDRPPASTRLRPARTAAIGVAALAVLVAALFAVSNLGVPGAEEPTVPYPIVEGELGAHLEQLQRSVEP